MEEYRPEHNNAAGMSLSPLNSARGTMVSVEQTRAIAEVQAAIVIAKANPRDEAQAEYRIVNACKRLSLAEGASYSFKRGTEVVTGPSIRLAETLARHWGNMNYGFREIGRDGESSEVETFCHDYETNVRVSRIFQVRHWRDKKSGGGTALTSERDKYEHVASQAQRRVRACILEIIPGDIAELAEESCKATLTKSIGNVEDKVKQIVESFAKLGVTDKQLESYLQRPLRSIVPADVVNLMRVYRSIRDGIASASEFFAANQENTKAGGLNERFKTPGATPPGTGIPPTNPPDPPPPTDSASTQVAQSAGETSPLQSPGTAQTAPPDTHAEPQNENTGHPAQQVKANPEKAKPEVTVSDLKSEINTVTKWTDLFNWPDKNKRRLKALGDDGRGEVLAYCNALMHMRQIDEKVSVEGLNQFISMKMVGLQKQFADKHPGSAADLFDMVSNHAKNKISELAGGKATKEEPPPSEEAPPSNNSTTPFLRFQEQIYSKESSAQLDQWAMATHDTREKQLSENEHAALLVDIAERRAELKAIEDEQAG